MSGAAWQSNQRQKAHFLIAPDRWNLDAAALGKLTKRKYEIAT